MLSARIASDQDLLDVARHVRRHPVPNVFFAAVHFLLFEAPHHELSSFYGSLCREPRPAIQAHHAFRDFGIDLNPVDLTNPIERRWFDALIWPEHAGRRRLASAAIDELLNDPPRIVKGDAVDVLEPELEKVPSDATLIVYNSAALCQGGAADEAAIAKILTAFSLRRPIHWLHCENEEVRLRSLDGGHMTDARLANKDGHGRWLEWLNGS